MKPRPEAIPAPEGARYWCVTLPTRGDHHFRFPLYAVADAVQRMLVTEQEARKKRDRNDVPQRVTGYAAAIGVCWHHRGFLLDSVQPPIASREDLAAWRTYGDAVCDELQEAGYSLLDILDLFNGCVAEMGKRLDLAAMVKEREGFFPVAPGTPTSLPSESA